MVADIDFKCVSIDNQGDVAVVKVFCPQRIALENLSSTCKFAQKSAADQGLNYNGFDIGNEGPYAVDADFQEITLSFGAAPVSIVPAGFIQEIKLRRT